MTEFMLLLGTHTVKVDAHNGSQSLACPQAIMVLSRGQGTQANPGSEPHHGLLRCPDCDTLNPVSS